jgi:hypothetical protein
MGLINYTRRVSRGEGGGGYRKVDTGGIRESNGGEGEGKGRNGRGGRSGTAPPARQMRMRTCRVARNGKRTKQWSE